MAILLPEGRRRERGDDLAEGGVAERVLRTVMVQRPSAVRESITSVCGATTMSAPTVRVAGSNRVASSGICMGSVMASVGGGEVAEAADGLCPLRRRPGGCVACCDERDAPAAGHEAGTRQAS